MLKNIAAVICAIALLTTATLAFSSESLNNPDYIEVSIEEIQSVSGEDNCVLTLTPSNYSVVTDLNDLPLPTLSGSGAPHLFLQVMCLIYNDQLDFIV